LEQGRNILECRVPTRPAKIRVLVVDDHVGIREGIRALIETQSDIVVVGEAIDGPEAVQQFESLRPDVTLMDISLPGFSGLIAIMDIRAVHPNSRFVVITASSGADNIHGAFEAGAGAFLYKDLMRFDLLPAIRAIHMGLRYIPDIIARRLRGS
jgi:DNA-binding NarL/FixJ family response regulator